MTIGTSNKTLNIKEIKVKLFIVQAFVNATKLPFTILFSAITNLLKSTCIRYLKFSY